jgi:hypothetical protein
MMLVWLASMVMGASVADSVVIRPITQLVPPALDPSLQVNLVWSGPGRITRESIPPIPGEIAALMRDVSSDGKLVGVALRLQQEGTSV